MKFMVPAFKLSQLRQSISIARPWLLFYPNPFNNELKIIYHIKDGAYRLRALNSTGVELVNEADQVSGNEYSIGRDWVSGFYIVIIEDRQR